jgi:apolipoprotein N-acyltransferase
LLWIALLPVLIAEDELTKLKVKNISVYFFLCFFTWGVLSVWWVAKSSFLGALFSIIIMSTQMVIIFYIYHLTKKKINATTGYIVLISSWLTMEYLSFNFELSFPWIILGNGLAKDVKLIQWYEYTGVLGGSLWILIINVLLFITYKSHLNKQKQKRNILIVIVTCIILTPSLISYFQFKSYDEHANPCRILLLQPNIDPYSEKFYALNNNDQLNIILSLAGSNIQNNTNYIIAPETSIVNLVYENEIKKDSSIIKVSDFIHKHPGIHFIMGLFSYKTYETNDILPPTAKKLLGESVYYDNFNSSMQIDSSPNIQLYHKSKLVPGVEVIPFSDKFPFLDNLAINLGGITGTLGYQKERTIFRSNDSKFCIGTVICYESVYGEYYSEFIKKGANLMVMITNDGWFQYPGHKQLLYFSSIRAIETRRSIARCANTGISAFINQKGEILLHTDWWKREILMGTINANNNVTFYTKHGDYIGRFSVFILLIIILGLIIRFLYMKFIKKKI